MATLNLMGPILWPRRRLGGATCLMAASDVKNRVSIWKFTQNDMLSFVDSAEYKLNGSRDVFSVEIKDILYLYVADYDDDTVNIFSLK